MTEAATSISIVGFAARRPRFGRVISVNVGEPRTMTWRGREIRTGIYKTPTDRPLALGALNLDGDGQADLVNHGGTVKAVYAYPSEHYAFWQEQLRGELPAGWGVFGENLTITGLLERELCIGDELAIGTARLRVTEPRFPCWKLGMRIGRDDIVDHFIQANRPGFYLSVLQEGEVAAGDTATITARDPGQLTVTELMRLRCLSGPADAAGLEAAIRLSALTEDWRDYLQIRLESLRARRPTPGWPGARRFRVVERTDEADGVIGVRLRPVDRGSLADFEPGQFVAIEADRTPGARPLVRCYSLVEPTGGGSLRIAVKAIEAPATADGGVSGRLHRALAVGDELRLRAPAGRFTPDPRGDRPLVLIAGGIGVTPIHAIAAAVARGDLRRATQVLYQARRPGEDPLADSLRRLAERSPLLDLRILYSRYAPEEEDHPTSEGPARLNARRVLETTGTTDVDVLLCGPAGMVAELPVALVAAGVDPERITLEAFGPPDDVVAPEVPFGGWTVTFARSNRSAVWEDAGTTLLELGEDSGVALPSSCRRGSCGTCAVGLAAGTVAYPAAPAVAIPEGMCLTCLAVPTGPVELAA